MMIKRRRGRAVDCLWVAQHTDAYLDGELNKKAAAALDEHLKECPDCAARVEEARELLALVSACDDVFPSATLHESVMQSVKEQPRAARTATPRNWRRMGGAIVVACFLLAVLLIPPTLLHDGPQEPAYDNNANGGNGAPGDYNDGAQNAPPFEEEGGHWWDNIFDSPSGDSNKDESEDNGSNGSSQEPDGGSEAPGGNGGTAVVLELTRVSGDGATDTLWERLGGEWQGEDIVLVIDSANNEAYLSTPKDEYCAEAYLNEDRLTLKIEGGSTLNFKVIMEGDALWLILIS